MRAYKNPTPGAAASGGAAKKIVHFGCLRTSDCVCKIKDSSYSPDFIYRAFSSVWGKWLRARLRALLAQMRGVRHHLFCEEAILVKDDTGFF